MFSILIWCVYGLFVGSIAKNIVPGEENFGLWKTIALGIAGSYTGGAALYLLGSSEALSPAGIIMGVAGAILALVVYNKVTTSTKI